MGMVEDDDDSVVIDVGIAPEGCCNVGRKGWPLVADGIRT